MFNSSQFNQAPFNSGVRTTLIGRVLLLAKDQAGLMAGKITLVAKDLRVFTNKTFLVIFDIMGLAAARKIKAVVNDIKVRFRIK